MGRQVMFYMLPEDQSAFLQHVQERAQVLVVARDADHAKVEPRSDVYRQGRDTLCLWNPAFLHQLERNWIPDPGYYSVDGLRTPTLEFTPSFPATWDGKRALGQGRLFGNFE